MAISDAWTNPITSAPVQVIGYRGEFDEFPYDLYSFLLSSIRDQDLSSGGLLYRWTRPMQQIWESIYTNILSLPELQSAEDCPSELLEYFGKDVGLTDDIDYLWGDLSELEYRRLARYFTRFLRLKNTPLGLVEAIQSMTGMPSDLMTYFDYRWILSGDDSTERECALGREDDGYDPYLLSSPDFPIGVMPDRVTYATPLYIFKIDTIVNRMLEIEKVIPPVVRVRCLLTNETTLARVYVNLSVGLMYAVAHENYLFGQLPSDISTEPSDFRVSFEPDEYVFDLLVTDDGTLNRSIPRGLARFNRPISEKVYVRYYHFIEKFEDFIRWDTITGTVVEGDREVTLGDLVDPTAVRINVTNTDDWADQCVTVKSSIGVPGKYISIKFQIRDNDNYYELNLVPNEVPTIPPGTWKLNRVVAAVPALIALGNLDYFDEDVDYIWRIVSLVSHRPGVDVQHIQIYQDEHLLDTVIDNPAPWAGDAKGTVEIEVEDGGTAILKRVLVNPVPMESDYVGL